MQMITVALIVISPQRLMIAEMAGFTERPANYEYPGKDGKPVQVVGRIVNIPNGEQGLFDMSGNKIDVPLSKLRLASTAEQKQPRFGARSQVKDASSPTGWSWVYPNLDQPGQDQRVLGAPPPSNAAGHINQVEPLPFLRCALT